MVRMPVSVSSSQLLLPPIPIFHSRSFHFSSLPKHAESPSPSPSINHGYGFLHRLHLISSHLITSFRLPPICSQNAAHRSTCLPHACQPAHLVMEYHLSHLRPLIPANHLRHLFHRPSLLEFKLGFSTLETDHRKRRDICHQYHPRDRSYLEISLARTDKFHQ